MALPLPLSAETARDLIAANDTQVFVIGSQTSDNDKRALLRIQNYVAGHNPAYVYLEIGSHLGGTLVPHLADARCAAVTSIDLRPAEQPSHVGQMHRYTDNSTARMMELLRAALPAATLGKLKTLDVDAADVPADQLPQRIDLAFIDGEHTNTAAFSDFVSVHARLAPDAVVAFHDAHTISDGLDNIERLMKHLKWRHEIRVLHDRVCVMGIGRYAEGIDAAFARVMLERRAFDKAAREGSRNVLVQRALAAGDVPLKSIQRGLWKRVQRAFGVPTK